MGCQARGNVGAFLADGLDSALSTQGSVLLLSAVILVGVTWLTGFSWLQSIEHFGEAIIGFFGLMMQVMRFMSRHSARMSLQGMRWLIQVYRKPRMPPAAATQRPRPSVLQPPTGVKKIAQAAVANSEKPITSTRVIGATPPARPAAPSQAPLQAGLPDLTLLDADAPLTSDHQHHSPQLLEQMSRELEQHLLDFGIHAGVVAVHPGPVITRFELQLAAGVKVSRLSVLAKDLARALSVTSVRVVKYPRQNSCRVRIT